MRLLLDQMATVNAEHIRTAEELQKDHEIVYWIRMEEFAPLDHARFPKTVFHNYHDALKNVPPPSIDARDFKYWSEDEIVAMAHWEAEAMSMMDKWYPQWPVNQRKDFYFELLRYWGGVIDRFRPELIVFNAPPHQMFNLVLYAIAKQRGIGTILFDYSFRTDRVIWSRDYRIGNPVLAKWRNTYARDGASGENLSAQMRSYYASVSQTANPTPMYLADAQKLFRSWPRLKRRIAALKPFLLDGTIFIRAMRRVVKTIQPDLRDVYRAQSKPADLKSDYVYMPLGFQPEATTSPQGGIFVEQILAIRMLSQALPRGWMLYVKEHPGQWLINGGDFNVVRYRGFYEQIASLPNVQLVPMTTSTFELADHAQAVATITSTAAWEGILRGTCGLVFGYPWFMHAPGIAQVSSVEDCREAFGKIQAGLVPDAKELLAYLATLETVTFAGSLHAAGDSVKDADGARQWEAMHRVIAREIGEIAHARK